MTHNQGVIYMGPSNVEVRPIDFPKLQNPLSNSLGHNLNI